MYLVQNNTTINKKINYYCSDILQKWENIIKITLFCGFIEH